MVEQGAFNSHVSGSSPGGPTISLEEDSHMTTKHETCPKCTFKTLTVMTFLNKVIEHCEHCHYNKVIPLAKTKALEKESV